MVYIGKIDKKGQEKFRTMKLGINFLRWALLICPAMWPVDSCLCLLPLLVLLTCAQVTLDHRVCDHSASQNTCWPIAMPCQKEEEGDRSLSLSLRNYFPINIRWAASWKENDQLGTSIRAWSGADSHSRATQTQHYAACVIFSKVIGSFLLVLT